MPGFAKAAQLDEIKQNDFVLTPGRYVEAAEAEVDDEPIDEKVNRLVTKLEEEFARGAQLELEIRKNLRGLGYGS